MTPLGRWGAAIAALLVFSGGESDLHAQDGMSDGYFQFDEHRHDPIDVDARPIVARSKVPLLRPRRLLLDPEGHLFIADWEAGAVLKVSPDEQVTIFADGLHEPAGLARDFSGNLYITTHAGGMIGAGTVVRISAAGDRSVFAEGLSGPTALAFDPHGDLYVANFHANNIVRIAPDGDVVTFVENVPAPAALAFDPAGDLFAASSTEGTVFRIDAMGNVAVHARGLTVPSDLAFDPQDNLIVANYGGTELSYIDDEGDVRPFAVVPKGTIAHVFDPDGNLMLVNWDYQILMKVTTTLSVPCPHCGRDIPIRLRPKQNNARPAKSPVL